MSDVYEFPTHLDAIREAWHEFKEGVGFTAFCLSDDDGDGHRLPALHAWLCAPWLPLAYRFTPHNLEKLFRPRKAERRQRLWNLHQWVFHWGADDVPTEQWAEIDALVAEFGGDFPPRDWQPMTMAETAGLIMGYSREEVAEILAEGTEAATTPSPALG